MIQSVSHSKPVILGLTAFFVLFLSGVISNVIASMAAALNIKVVAVCGRKEENVHTQ
jgi:hypothetical protein